MKKVKKLVALAVASIMVMGVLTGCGSSNESSDKGGENTTTETGDQDTAEKTIKVGVCLYKFDDTYISTVRQNLTKIQEENKGKVEFEFFDGKGDQSVQNDMIDTLLQKNYDLLMVNLVDIGAGQTVVDKIKTSGVPVVLFNREPSVDVIKSYEDAVFVGTNASEAGVMQYVMFQGEPDNPEAVARTKYSVETIEEASIKTEKLELQPCNWQQDLAQTTMEAWLANHGDKIEVVIANNDGMALGAVAALQNQGYNKGDESKFIPVVGVDAVDAAKDYIEKGYMTGSVLQDAEGMAKALYEIGMNLAQDKSAIDGTSYEFDDTGVSVRIPYQPYVK